MGVTGCKGAGIDRAGDSVKQGRQRTVACLLAGLDRSFQSSAEDDGVQRRALQCPLPICQPECIQVSQRVVAEGGDLLCGSEIEECVGNDGCDQAILAAERVRPVGAGLATARQRMRQASAGAASG